MIQNKLNIIDLNNNINNKNNKNLLISAEAEAQGNSKSIPKNLLELKQSNNENTIQLKNHSSRKRDSDEPNEDLKANAMQNKNRFKENENGKTNKNYNTQVGSNNINAKDNNSDDKANENNLKLKAKKNKKFEIDENSNIELKYDEADFTSEAAKEQLKSLKENLSLSTVEIKEEKSKKTVKKEKTENLDVVSDNKKTKQVADLVSNNIKDDSNKFNSGMKPKSKESGEFFLTGIENEKEDENYNSIKNKNINEVMLHERFTYYNSEKGRFTATNGFQRIKSDLIAFNDGKVQNIILSDEEWIGMIAENTIDESLREKIIISLKYGINHKLRGKIWVLLSDSIKEALKHNNQKFYELLKTENSDLESKIEKDIDRTFLIKIDKSSKDFRKSNFLDFKDKKKNLFNVLKAYGNMDPEVAYCQGTNYIVALLLYHLDSERLVFWVFHQIMNKFLWRFIYLNKTPKLIRLIDSFKITIKTEISDLDEHFEKLEFYEMFNGLFSPFFITMFSYNIPIEYSVRVLDLFWIYQEKIIFDCLIHLLKLSKTKLMRMDFEEMMNFIRQDMTKDCLTRYGVQACMPFKFD